MKAIECFFPLHRTTPDGVQWLEFIAEPGESIYEQYMNMPNALEKDGKLYRKVSHNSDSFKIVYRECDKSDLAFRA